jgi:uncharacterized protein (DUF58 family)
MHNRRNTVYLLIIACLVTGLFTGRLVFFKVASILTALLFVAMIWSWLAVRWISMGRRTRSRRAQVGNLLEEAFYVHSRAWFPRLWLEIIDHSELPGHRASHVVPAMGIRSTYRWYVQTLCRTRGEFRLGPMTMTSGDPFGLFVSERHLDASSKVIVYPATVPLSRFELPVGLLSGGDAQRRRTHYITTNAAGVRDYAPGDSFNRIHWRSSARKDRLIVKEFELDPLVDIWLFADFSRYSLFEHESVHRIGGSGPVVPEYEDLVPSTEEYVAILAASLAKHFSELERSLGFAAYTPNRVIHQPERGNRQFMRILETLAVARSLSDHSLRQMLVLETPHFTRGTTLLIVTSTIDMEWIIEAQILNSRGIRTMCILVDAGSMGGPQEFPIVQDRMHAAKIPFVVVRHRDDISAVLQRKVV